MQNKKGTMHSTWFHLQMRLLKYGCNQNDCIHVMWRAQKPFILATPVAGSTTDGNMLHFSYSTRCSCSSINVHGSPCACVAILCTTKKNIFDQFNWRYLLWRPFIPELVREKLHHRNSANNDTLKIAKFDPFWNFCWIGTPSTHRVATW